MALEAMYKASTQSRDSCAAAAAEVRAPGLVLVLILAMVYSTCLVPAPSWMPVQAHVKACGWQWQKLCGGWAVVVLKLAATAAAHVHLHVLSCPTTQLHPCPATEAADFAVAQPGQQ